MTSAIDAPRRHTVPVEDGIVLLDGVTWSDYERLLEIRGDRTPR